MNMQEVLTYPLGPLPWYILRLQMVHLQRQQKPHCFTSQRERPNTLNMFLGPLYGYWTAWLLHSTKYVPMTFSSLANYVFHLVTPVASQDRTRTDMTMDQNPDVSIKNPEREQRCAGGSIQIAINHGNQMCPTQWKKYLTDGSNNANLAYFLMHEWQSQNNTL